MAFVLERAAMGIAAHTVSDHGDRSAAKAGRAEITLPCEMTLVSRAGGVPDLGILAE